MSKKPTLPDKLSAVMRVALKDEAYVHRSPMYRVNMDYWHTPVFTADDKIEFCEVCLAGAVMAGTLGADINKEYNQRDWPENKTVNGNIAKKLRALDCIRHGSITIALITFDINCPPVRECDHLMDEIRDKIGEAPQYHGGPDEDLSWPDDRKAWRKWMFQCAKELEARGL